MRAGWITTTLGEVCLFENGDRGKNYPSKSDYVNDGIPFVNAGHLKEGKVSLEGMNYISGDCFNRLGSGKFQTDDVLFCLRGSLGKFGVVGPEIARGAVASSLVIVRPKSNHKTQHGISVGFMSHYLSSSFCAEMIAKFAGGAAQPNLGARDLKRFLLFLPPLPEQARIVAILDEAFAAIATATAHAEQNLANAQELFESCCSRFIVEDSRKYKQVTLGDACKGFHYGTSRKSAPQGIVPVVRMGNLQDGEINWNEPVYTSSDDDIAKYKLNDRDVLFNRTNSPKHVGKTAMFRGKRAAVFAGYLIRVAWNADQLDPNYLNLFLNSRSVRAYGKTVMSWSINQANINATKLGRYPIRLPPLQEQKLVAEKLMSIRNEVVSSRAKVKVKLKELLSLKQSLLHKAFTGQLTANNKAADRTLAEAGV